MCHLNSSNDIVTLLSAAIILTITSIEFFDYRRVNIDTSIVVDRSRGEKLTAKLNVTFPRVPCYCECCNSQDPVALLICT